MGESVVGALWQTFLFLSRPPFHKSLGKGRTHTLRDLVHLPISRMLRPDGGSEGVQLENTQQSLAFLQLFLCARSTLSTLNL